MRLRRPNLTRLRSLVLKSMEQRTEPFVYPATVRLLVLSGLVLLLLGSAGCRSLRDRRPHYHPDPLPSFATASVVVVDESGKERRIPLMDLTEHFLALSTRAQNNHPADVNEFIAAGLNVSDEIVERWFREQYSLQANSHYYQNTANVAAGLGTAVLGITDASSRAVALLGTGVTAMNAQWRNVEAHYLIAPSLPVVIQKIREFRAEQRRNILAGLRTQTLTYTDAVAILRSYHQTASRETIQRFLQRSAEISQFTAIADDRASESQAEVGAHSSVVYALLNEDAAGFYSERDLVALFAILTEPANSDVLQALRDAPRYRAMSDRVADVTETGRNRLIGRMLALDNLLGLEKRVETLREAAANARQDLQFGASLSSQARAEFSSRNSQIYSLLNARQAGSYSLEQLVEIYGLAREEEHPAMARRIQNRPETARLAEQVRALRNDPNRSRQLETALEDLDRVVDLDRRLVQLEDVEHGLSALGPKPVEGPDRIAAALSEAVREALNSPARHNLMSDWKVVPSVDR